MASPKVFISSTCYDLSEIRDALKGFIEEHGFETCLSDYGDVFYHPDIHTHDSCINEISNCHLFVLLIGGRFGGSYVSDTEKSIVNAEYFSAKKLGIPVFTFIKKEVLDDHRFYRKNYGKDFSEFEFPSIDKQSNSLKIFSFIDEVRLAEVNNGFFPFENSRQIQALLKKQWAGMFFDFLQKRKYTNELKLQQNVLSDLKSTGEQLEEIVKTIYRKLDADNANNVIETVEHKAAAEKLFRDLRSYFSVPLFTRTLFNELISIPIPDSLEKFLTATKDFYILKDVPNDEGDSTTDIMCHHATNTCYGISGDLTGYEINRKKDFHDGYNSFLKLTKEEREEVLSQAAKNA